MKKDILDYDNDVFISILLSVLFGKGQFHHYGSRIVYLCRMKVELYFRVCSNVVGQQTSDLSLPRESFCLVVQKESRNRDRNLETNFEGKGDKTLVHHLFKLHHSWSVSDMSYQVVDYLYQYNLISLVGILKLPKHSLPEDNANTVCDYYQCQSPMSPEIGRNVL